MASADSRGAILAAIDGGVEAVEAAATGSDPAAPTGCADWSVHDLVRHLEAIAGAYLLWVGAAIGGRIGTMRTPHDLRAYNDQMLHRLPQVSTPQHLGRFLGLARDHRRLVDSGWDLPMMRTPTDAVLQVGDHGGVAALEWHVHAWDLGSRAGGRHRPAAAVVDTLCATWDDTLADVTDTERNASQDPWDSLLMATGRTPA